MSDQCKQRRQAFIDDIVEVCKRHRVLLEVDEERYGEFIEQADIEGYGFNVSVGELERLCAGVDKSPIACGQCGGEMRPDTLNVLVECQSCGYLLTSG
jgi:hypothetical protein